MWLWMYCRPASRILKVSSANRNTSNCECACDSLAVDVDHGTEIGMLAFLIDFFNFLIIIHGKTIGLVTRKKDGAPASLPTSNS